MLASGGYALRQMSLATVCAALEVLGGQMPDPSHASGLYQGHGIASKEFVLSVLKVIMFYVKPRTLYNSCKPFL